MSVQIATQLAIYSYPLGDFSCGERADIVFNIDKVADIFLNSCDVVYILFVNYMRGFSSIIFNIIVAYKFVWSVHKIFIKIRSHIRYRAINKRLSQSFLNATKEDIEKVGRCVICCESLKEGKKLDCGHIFHLRCILNWLKYKNLCPMCRKSITIQNADSAQNAFLIGNSSLNASYERRGANTVFRLNTPRLGFLLPSINFEFHQIFSGSNIGNRQRRTEANSRAAPDTRHEQMVHNVSQIVPNVPVETIRWQLRRNNYNVTRAVNNLLD
ncbi:hypothetical protein MHBO_000325 [Bonamia ostreae]|uniref:RING-type domain-containing protein n=1 Tax=Bonamia ostreae TaxID=126728 RepID=A0ABV2AF73_9EUKA